MENEEKFIPIDDDPVSINELARMTAQGFEDIIKRIDEGFKRTEERFSRIEDDLDAMKAGTASLNTGQQDIRARLEDIPTRSEFAHLKERVIETEIQIRHLQGARA